MHRLCQPGHKNIKTEWVDVDIDWRAVLKLILKNYDVMIFVLLVCVKTGFS